PSRSWTSGTIHIAPPIAVRRESPRSLSGAPCPEQTDDERVRLSLDFDRIVQRSKWWFLRSASIVGSRGAAVFVSLGGHVHALPGRRATPARAWRCPSLL